MNATILRFDKVGRRDVYNPAVLNIEGELLLAGRVESRVNAVDSTIVFFREDADGVFVPVSGAPVFPLEDPSLTRIGNKIILGGTEVDWDRDDVSQSISYRMQFFIGETLETLIPFMTGPEGMKDIRLLELPDGRIAVFTRPKGGEYGSGKIGITILKTLDEFSAPTLQHSHILDGVAPSGMWCGTNAAYLLEDGRIGVLAHRAYRDESGFHYEAGTFKVDPDSLDYTPFRTIVTRDDFPPTEAKREELIDVVFPGGLVKRDLQRWTLYAGLSDTNTGRLDLNDPFS